MLAVVLCALSMLPVPTDTVKVDVSEADRMFAQKNLMALAAEYQVEASKALQIQAKLYPNPIVSAELNAIDPQNEKYFHVGKTGQKLVAVNQLILLGGKRRSSIELSRQNTMIAGYELEDLLRNLKLQLHQNLYTVYFNEKAVTQFDQQLLLLDSIIASYETQARKGNIPYKEVIRLKSVYIRINNEKTNFTNEILEGQRILQTLLQTTSYISPQFSSRDWSTISSAIGRDSLVNLALANRPDYKIAKASIDYAHVNLRLQKQMVVPDLNLGGAWDQRGGAFQNQVGLTLAMPLPVLNRNKGNIQFAQHQLHIAEIQDKELTTEIASEVVNTSLTFDRSIAEYRKARLIYNQDFEIVFNGVSENFQRRNITLLEFVDFFESYNETVIQVNRMERQVAMMSEQLNYATAYPLY